MKCQSILFAILLPSTMLLVGCGGDTPSTNGAGTASSNPAEQITAPGMDLHSAVIADNVQAVRQHIQAGSDIDVPDPFGGSSPLISAAIFGKTEIAQLLIDAGADVDFTNRDGSTALHSAAFFGRPEIVEALLEAGADKSIVNNYGSTPRDTVAGGFDEMKPFYDALGATLAPMGLKLDYDRLRATRPQIAAALL